MQSIIRVALDVPVAKLFDYSADVTLDDVGRRVIVPFGPRRVVGVIIDISNRSALPRERIKAAVAIIRDAPGFTRDDLRLLRFAAEYYQYPLGQAIAAALPQRLRRVKVPRVGATHFALTPAGQSVPLDALAPRARAKRTLLARFQAACTLSRTEIRQTSASASAALQDFISRDWVVAVDVPEESNAHDASAQHAPKLTSAQRAAAAAISDGIGRFQPFLFFGITGSGKTEVYLQVVAQVLAAGKQALLLLPEIALTPQLETLVRERFRGVLVVSLHSGLNEGERLYNWTAAQAGRARVVLGTRLAVFTPLPELGLVVVDEENDASYKQTEGFCYSARDLAVVRARQRAVPVVLASATPSLESYHNSRAARYALVELHERINAVPPRIECIALEAKTLGAAFAPASLEAIGERLQRGEQTLVFINRRGYAPMLMCHACGWISGCTRCSARLVLHLTVRELQCHHCGHREPVPHACPDCGNPALLPIGQGTQRVEEALADHFSSARILRVDRDTTRRKNAWSNMREQIRAREVDILVGTQILAKGHDFAHLALVVVLNADGMLYSADFRASERLYALLTQVAGRAGRRDVQGLVLVQTEFPNHALYRALQAQDYAEFADCELEQREQTRFPPFVHQALLRAEAREIDTALAFLARAKKNAPSAGGVQLFDPVPATMTRLAGRERAQLLVQSSARGELQAFLRSWRENLTHDKSHPVRWLIDVDPLEL